MLRIGAIFVLFSASALGAAEPTIEAALQRMYDFDFPASHEILDRYIAAHPQDPLPYAFRASAYLFYELDRLGILESEFLVDDNKIAEKKKKLDPDPENRAKFVRAVNDAESRVDAALKADPNDRQALFAMCIAQGVTTDYMAFVEKRQISSLSVAKRSNSYAQRLLKLDSKFYDAYLTAGITEYMLGSLPFSSAGSSNSIMWTATSRRAWTGCSWWRAKGITSSRLPRYSSASSRCAKSGRTMRSSFLSSLRAIIRTTSFSAKSSIS